MDRNKEINVHTIESIFEMDMIKDALDNNGIPYTIKEHRDTAYDGLFILQKGFASLYVREVDKDRVLDIIRKIRNLPYVAYSKDE
ncbi:MAG: putative signal transducing protein [Syntrophorhabdaceae bacterium]